VLAETFRFGFGLVVVIAAGIGFGVTPDQTLPLVLLVVGVQLIFTVGVGFWLSALNIFFRDVQHLSDYLFRAWFFLSPTLYPLSHVPDRYRDLYDLNPFATILPAYHDVLLDQGLPDFARLGVVAGAGSLIAVAGYVVFVRLEPSFAKVH
jgi:ABC-type polysaccharide/polyol phosphate export permease